MMKLTFLGHSCFLIEINGKKILLDPFISPNELASEVDIDKIEADYVFLSHGHEDHVADAEKILKRTAAKLVSNFEIVSWYEAKGIENNHPMNLGGSKTFEFGTVKLVNAIHSSVLPDGSYGGNPGGFIFKTNSGNFYYSGDTALTYDMKLIADEVKLDFAILCIGDNFTMGVKDAIRAADFINCEKIIGMHYDTFGYIKINHDEAKKAFSNSGKSLYLPDINTSIEF